MLKKILLIGILSIFSFENKPFFQGNNDKIVGAVIGVTAIGTAVYWLQRESNDSVIARSKQLVSQGNELINHAENYFYSYSKTADESSFVLLENKLLAMKSKIKGAELVVSDRYESYFAFWNWTDRMKEVHYELKKVLKKFHEVLYTFSFKRAVAFISKYQQIVEYNLELFANNKTLLHVLEQEKKYLKKDLFVMMQQGETIRNELVEYAKDLDCVDKKTERDIAIMLEKILFMQTVLKYGDCILCIDSETQLIRNARKTVGSASSYPIKDFVSELSFDIKKLASMKISFEVCVQNSIEILKNVLEEVIASKEYAQERQAYEMYLQEQRKVSAAEAQAKAAQDQADAEYQKAYAMNEQNRIQKERNKIQRERNKIEEQK